MIDLWVVPLKETERLLAMAAGAIVTPTGLAVLTFESDMMLTAESELWFKVTVMVTPLNEPEEIAPQNSDVVMLFGVVPPPILDQLSEPPETDEAARFPSR